MHAPDWHLKQQKTADRAGDIWTPDLRSQLATELSAAASAGHLCDRATVLDYVQGLCLRHGLVLHGIGPDHMTIGAPDAPAAQRIRLTGRMFAEDFAGAGVVRPEAVSARAAELTSANTRLETAWRKRALFNSSRYGLGAWPEPGFHARDWSAGPLASPPRCVPANRLSPISLEPAHATATTDFDPDGASAPFAGPHLVIIDEDPSAGLPQAITVEIEALGMAAEWATLLPDDGDEPKPRKSQQEFECEVSDETDDATPDSVLDMLDMLRDGLACPAPLQEIATDIAVVEFEAALKMLRGLERKLRGGLKPGLPDHVLREHLAVTALPNLQSLQVVLSAILEEVRLFVSGAIDRPEFNGISLRKDANGELRSITAHRLARPAIKPDLPMIVLDGTADPVLMGRALRRRMVVSRIDLQRQGEVVQCIGRGFSSASLVPTTVYQVSAKIAAEREQLWQGLDTVLRREVAAAPAGVLVVSTLAVEGEARQRRCCDDLLGVPLAWTHFGAVRGINAFTHRQTIVLIGRKQPSLPRRLAVRAAPTAMGRPPPTIPFAPRLPVLMSAMCIDPPRPWQYPVSLPKNSANIRPTSAPLAMQCPWPRWVEVILSVSDNSIQVATADASCPMDRCIVPWIRPRI